MVLKEGVAYRSRSFSRRNPRHVRGRRSGGLPQQARTNRPPLPGPCQLSPARNRFHPGKLEPERVVTAKPAVSQIRHLRLGTTPNGSQQIPRARVRGNTLPRPSQLWLLFGRSNLRVPVHSMCGRVPFWVAGSEGASVGAAGSAGASAGWQEVRERRCKGKRPGQRGPECCRAIRANFAPATERLLGRDCAEPATRAACARVH